jgi:riboflavin synthase
MVQGHVDITAELISIENKQGSYLLTFSFPSEFSKYVVEKGSICVNGISLTVVNVVGEDPNHGLESINVVGEDTNHETHLSVGVSTNRNIFSVAIIPYTWENTNLQKLKIGDAVNIEFDVIGKYVERMMQIRNQDEVDLSDMHG